MRLKTMAEFDEFRYVLSDLKETYGDKSWITLKELCEHEGINIKTAKKRYKIPKGAGGIDRAVLARRKCLLAN